METGNREGRHVAINGHEDLFRGDGYVGYAQGFTTNM